ncbi:hypothetical protein PIB30_045875 [Stylosanthes scabra]|uniref:Uncharacterized protein n=1 Tax=Stylosanthes scabra TaxID=79078 RepID=A0ABU6RGA3_9FABA|nr:hypothetical protein [Stylosanthes scabra]
MVLPEWKWNTYEEQWIPGTSSMCLVGGDVVAVCSSLRIILESEEIEPLLHSSGAVAPVHTDSVSLTNNTLKASTASEQMAVSSSSNTWGPGTRSIGVVISMRGVTVSLGS